MKGKKIPIIITVIIVIITVLVALIKFDIGKIGSKYAFPKLKNVPVVKYILPKVTVDDPYANYTKEQLINIITGSELQLKEATTTIEERNDKIVDLEKQIENLKVFESEHTKFREEKREFDELVASQNQNEFTKFYEAMYSEHAKEIYAEIVQTNQMTKKQKQYATMIAEIDETQAARVLENLTATDMDIVITILSNMDMESSAAILGQMDAQIAATVVKQLSP